MLGFAVLPFVSVWQAEKAAEEAAQVRPHAECIRSQSQCERHVLMRHTSLG